MRYNLSRKYQVLILSILFLYISFLLPHVLFADSVVTGAGMRNFHINSYPSITDNTQYSLNTRASHITFQSYFYEKFIGLGVFMALPAYDTKTTPTSTLENDYSGFNVENNSFQYATALGVSIGPSYTFSPGGVLEFNIGAGPAYLAYWYQLYFFDLLPATTGKTYKPRNYIDHNFGFEASIKTSVFFNQSAGITLGLDGGWYWVLNKNSTKDNGNLSSDSQFRLQDNTIGTYGFSIGVNKKI